MSVRQLRREARAKMARLETARRALAALTDDECALIYLELEARLVAAQDGGPCLPSEPPLVCTGGGCEPCHVPFSPSPEP